MSKYNTVLFDLDGTLTEPKEGITRCVQYALEKLGHNPPQADQLVWFIGPPLRDSFAEYLHTSDNELIEEAVRLYRIRYAEKGMFENNLYDGVTEMLGKLQSHKFNIVLATSKAGLYAQQILEHFSINQYFNHVIGSNMDGSMCEKTEIISHIVKLLSELDKKNMVMVGDRVFDIIGAKNNGLDSIGVTFGYGSVEEIKENKPTYIADSIKSIYEILIG